MCKFILFLKMCQNWGFVNKMQVLFDKMVIISRAKSYLKLQISISIGYYDEILVELRVVWKQMSAKKSTTQQN